MFLLIRQNCFCVVISLQKTMGLQRATINARRGFYIRRFNFHWRYNKVQKLHWIFMSNLDKVEQLFKLACTFKLTVPILFYFKTFDKKTACACNVPAAHLPRSIGTRHSYKRFIYSYKRIFIYTHIFIYSCFEFICVYERFIYSYNSI